MSHRTADKRFSTYSKTTPLFQLGEGLFSTQLTEPSILKKPEVRKPIGVTDPPAPPLTWTTFQQQRTSAVQDRNRNQGPINNLRNRSDESRNRSTMNYTTPQVIHQPLPSSGASGLLKLKLTEFSGDPLEWPEWSGLFDVVVQLCRKDAIPDQLCRKDAIPQEQSHGSSKSSNIGNGIQLAIILSCLGYTL